MLNQSKVVFDAENHTYTLNGIQLKGITGVISRHIFPDKYSNVPKDVLKKAAERGSLIHSTCQIADDMGLDMDSTEAKGYLELKDKYNLQYEASEYLVSDERNFASCIDKVYKSSENLYSLGDIKTTYKLDKEYLMWQLSIYAFLFERQNPHAKADKLYGIWLRDNVHELIEVERIPDHIISELLQCEADGRTFTNPYARVSEINLPARYREMEESIIEIEYQAKYWAEKKKELVEGIMKEMVKAGAYSWKGENISVTRKKESIRKDFDKKSLEKDHPEIYNQYVKETPVAGSITLKIS